MCFFPTFVSHWIRGVFLLRACELFNQHYHYQFVSHMTLYIAPSRTFSALTVHSLAYEAFGFPAYVQRCIWYAGTQEPPLGCMLEKLCGLFNLQNISVHRPNTKSFRFLSYSPTVHLICRHSSHCWTVWRGNFVFCSIFKILQFRFPSYSPTVFFVLNSYIKGLIHKLLHITKNIPT